MEFEILVISLREDEESGIVVDVEGEDLERRVFEAEAPGPEVAECAAGGLVIPVMVEMND